MAEKVFIEIDEEIIFIVEKVKRALDKEVILIIPDRSQLLGSVVSLKLLAQEIAKSDKYVVLVTEDEIGERLARKSGFVVVNKVNIIDKDIWEKVRKKKEFVVNKMEKRKKSLVAERNVNGKDSQKASVEEGSKVPSRKKKLAPKKVEVEGFEMMAGGDIAREIREEVDHMIEDKSEDGADKTKETKRNEEQKNKLIGTNMANYSYSQVKGKKDKNEKKKGDSFGMRIDKFLNKIGGLFGKGNSQKYIIGGIIILIAFFLVSYFVLPSANVVVEVESEDITLSENVIADTSIFTLDTDNLVIPAEELEITRDRSDSADATGEKETGQKASGTITVFNLSSEDIVLPAGTSIESIETGFTYLLNVEATAPAKKPDDDPEDPGLIGSVDVGIIADNFGDDYNVAGKQEFRVQGYDVENIYAKNFTNITGGTIEVKKVVDKSDVENLQEDLETSLKEDVKAALLDEVGETREVIEDTIEYEVINTDASPGEGAEAGTFNLSVTMKVTALSFDKENIDSLATDLVASKNEQEVEIEEFEYSSEVQKSEDKKIYIKLNITGVVTPQIDKESLRDNLVGKSESAGIEYLKGQKIIDNYQLELAPKWMPAFLKHFPSSKDKIKIEINKIS